MKKFTGGLKTYPASEEKITRETLSSLEKKSISDLKENHGGVTEYPILEFDKRSLGLLYRGVRETLKTSKIKPSGGKLYNKIKRVADVVIASSALAVLSLPMGITALAIYLYDGGSPVFTQVRLTENGKPFVMYKFRSMCMNAEEKFAEVQKTNECDGLAYKNEDDPRITKIGKFIRRTSIDELPQLINVINGDMSLIGPRPPLPREVVLYTPHEMQRLLVKGGLACISQCEGRSEIPFDKSVENDLTYIKKRGLFMDMKILFKMVDAVLTQKGAK